MYLIKARYNVAIVGALLVLGACSNAVPPHVGLLSASVISSGQPQPATRAALAPPKTLMAVPLERPPSPMQHVGPATLYPNLELTPGEHATLDVDDLTRDWTDNCPNHKPRCTYSQDHRNVPRPVHIAVYDEYNVPEDERNIKSGEVDHFWPLCAGGSNDIKNLWYQPAINESNGENLGYHEKDKPEDEVCKEIKAGQLDPTNAYQLMTTDWVAFYHQKFQGDSGTSAQQDNGDQ